VLQSGVDGGDAKAKDSSDREADVQMSPQGMNMPDPKDVLAVLWRSAEQPESALEAIKLTGTEPGLPSSFAVGTAAQATIAAAALAAGEL
jgi:hypothetical protein